MISMTLLEKLNNIASPKLLQCPTGQASSLDQFWDIVVAPLLPSKETIIRWHELLVKYVNSDYPTSFISLYIRKILKSTTKLSRASCMMTGTRFFQKNIQRMVILRKNRWERNSL